ncbi:MAG: zinc-ribbon domain-containing protein [Promethearchaeota archaeon]
MDVSKFNQKLGTIIAKAKSLENNNNLNEAIKYWLKLSEMTLEASKNPELDISFRTMLINKTEQIVMHIKDLKIKLNKPIVKEVDDVINIKENECQENLNEFNDLNLPKPPLQNSIHILDNNLKNIPDGFKEIEPLNFKIITPHDPKYVDELVKKSEEINIKTIMGSNKNNKSKSSSKSLQAEINLDKTNVGGDKICFACGTENPENTKFCIACGTELE